jgi:hypothetical protein
MKDQREARLKTEFAHLYPGLKPRIWYNAAWLSARQFARVPCDGRAASIEAMLNEAHFEFRGGIRRRSGTRSAKLRRT